jgi:hypothetical protein
MNLSDVEIIFVDDCSDPPLMGDLVTFYRTENTLAWTQGLGRNLGASKAKGEYLFMTDIDHILSKEAIEDALAFTGNKMIFRRQIAILDENGDLKQDKETLKDWGYESERLDASVHGNTFVMKKSIFDQLGGYDKDKCTIGYHPARRQGEDCHFNAKWNHTFVGTQPAVGRDIYMFPIGRFRKDGDLNPKGLFHNLHQRQEIQHKSKGILYYSDNQIDESLAQICRDQIKSQNIPITSVTLKPIDFGKNICLNLKRGYEAMFEQILVGLENMSEDMVYFCEHDVLYHPTHFDFVPKEETTFYYNGNYWFLRLSDGFAINYDVSPLSGLVVHRESALKHFRERYSFIKKNGFSYKIGFEPFTHRRIKWDYWCNFKLFFSEFPNVDISHGANVTRKRWSTDKFRRKPKFWRESDIHHIPGWEIYNKLKELMTNVMSLLTITNFSYKYV